MLFMLLYVCIFFFKQKTAYEMRISDWSSDVCSSDLGNYSYKQLRHSLCHGWASGPTSWLTRHVLGVSVVDPGCRTIRVEPHLADLEWVEGTFPTPYGVVKIKHTKGSDGKITTEVDAPDEVKVLK